MTGVGDDGVVGERGTKSSEFGVASTGDPVGGERGLEIVLVTEGEEIELVGSELGVGGAGLKRA